jgi:putative membrane protein
MMGWGDGAWGWGGWAAVVGMIVFWAAVVAGVIAVWHYSRRGGSQPPPGEDGRDRALQVLDERFARGEIDAVEYRNRRNLIRSG